MDGAVAVRRPTRALAEEPGMLNIPNEYARSSLNLRMAAQAKVGVGVSQQFGV